MMPGMPAAVRVRIHVATRSSQGQRSSSCQWHAGEHLRDIDGWVKIITLSEIPAKTLSEEPTNSGLSGARNTHNDENRLGRNTTICAHERGVVSHLPAAGEHCLTGPYSRIRLALSWSP